MELRGDQMEAYKCRQVNETKMIKKKDASTSAPPRKKDKLVIAPQKVKEKTIKPPAKENLASAPGADELPNFTRLDYLDSRSRE